MSAFLSPPLCVVFPVNIFNIRYGRFVTVNETVLIHCYQLKSIAPSDFLSFYLMLFFWSRSPSTVYLVVSLGYSWLRQFLRSALFCWPWQFWEVPIRYTDRVLLCWNLSDLFLWLDQIYKGFGEVDHRGKVPFSSPLSRVRSILWLLILMTWLSSVFQVCLVSYSCHLSPLHTYSSDKELWLLCHCAKPLLEWGVTLLLL